MATPGMTCSNRSARQKDMVDSRFAIIAATKPWLGERQESAALGRLRSSQLKRRTAQRKYGRPSQPLALLPLNPMPLADMPVAQITGKDAVFRCTRRPVTV